MRTAFIRLLSLLLSLSCWQRAQAQDNALHFDGIDDRADTAILTNGEAATVEAWVVPEAILDPISGQIYNGNGGAVAGGPHMVLEIKDGRPVGRMWNGTTSVGWVTGNSIVTGIPTHLAYVYDHQSDRAELYVDGQLAGSASAPDPLAHTSSRVLGGHPIEPRHYRGVLDEFRLWNRGLSGTEILDRKDSCLTGTEAGLLVYYRLNQGSAGGANPGLIQVVDSSLSGVPGILSNFGLGGASSNWVPLHSGSATARGRTTVSPRPTRRAFQRASRLSAARASRRTTWSSRRRPFRTSRTSSSTRPLGSSFPSATVSCVQVAESSA